MKILKDLVQAVPDECRGCLIFSDLQDTGKEWIKHFMDRFDIAPEYLPTKVRLEKYKRKEKRYNYSAKSGNKLLTWTMKEMPKDGVDAIIPGLSIIAWIKYFFGIKDGEELE